METELDQSKTLTLITMSPARWRADPVGWMNEMRFFRCCLMTYWTDLSNKILKQRQGVLLIQSKCQSSIDRLLNRSITDYWPIDTHVDILWKGSTEVNISYFLILLLQTLRNYYSFDRNTNTYCFKTITTWKRRYFAKVMCVWSLFLPLLLSGWCTM